MGFSVVNEAYIFLEFPWFSMAVGNLISGSSALSKSSLNIWKFMVHILLKPDFENFEHYFTMSEMSTIVQYFEHCLRVPFFRIGMKNDLLKKIVIYTEALCNLVLYFTSLLQIYYHTFIIYKTKN